MGLMLRILECFVIFIIFGIFIFSSQAQDLPALKIGILADLSGPFASSGADCKQGYELSQMLFTPEGRINGRSVELIYADHHGEIKSAISEFNKLVDIDRVAAILSNRSQIVMPLNPISVQKKIPILATVGHSEFVARNPYAFRFWPNANDEALALAKKIDELGYKRLGMLTLEDEYTLSVKDHLSQILTNGSSRIAFSDSVSPLELDLATSISRLKASNVDSIFLNLGPIQLGSTLRKVRELGLTQPVFSNFWIQKESVLDAAGRANAEGIIFIEMKIGAKFDTLIKNKFAQSRIWAAQYACFMGLSSIFQALQTDAKINDAETLYQTLSKLSQVGFGDETLQIKNREVRFRLIYRIIKNGEVQDL